MEISRLIASKRSQFYDNFSFNGKKQNIRKNTNVILSDFKVKDVADILSFSREFLNREPSELQQETLAAFAGEKGGEWNTDYHEIVLAVGMKGGKNFVTEIIVAYIAYFVSCLRNPHNYFTKITNRPVPYTVDKNFDVVNVSSVDETQARHVFFDSIKNVMKLTIDPVSKERWFEKYSGLDLRPGGFGDMKEKIIKFPSKIEGVGTLRFMSFNSTASAPEGAHFFCFIADELSRADTKAKYSEAKKLYELGLKNTAVSFPNRVGKVVGFSYLNDTDFDLTWERYNLSHNNEKIFGRLYSTYDYNPAITKEDLHDEYDVDEQKAKQIYECIKPMAVNNFFQPYVNKLREAVDAGLENKVEYKITTTTKEIKKVNKYTFTSVELLNIKGDTRQRVFAIDPSKVKDRFTIVGGYAETIDTMKMEYFIGDEKQIISTNIRPIIDFMMVVEPKQSRPIDYLAVAEVLTMILEAFPRTVGIYSDHFQNEKIRQEIIAQGVQSETYNFSNKQQLEIYTKLRANVWNNNIVFVQDQNRIMISNKETDLTSFLLFELEHMIKDGNKIDHPDWGSKDLADVVAIANNEIMKLETLGYSDEIDIINNEQFKKLVELYMKEKYELILAETPEKRINAIIQKKMELSEKQIKRIAEYAKEYYNY